MVTRTRRTQRATPFGPEDYAQESECYSYHLEYYAYDPENAMRYPVYYDYANEYDVDALEDYDYDADDVEEAYEFKE